LRDAHNGGWSPSQAYLILCLSAESKNVMAYWTSEEAREDWEKQLAAVALSVSGSHGGSPP
jgi:hypothetical protein